MTLPMLADFATRLSCGLSLLLLITPWREVPLKFFRTHCLVILGLLVLGSLDAYRVAPGAGLVAPLAASAVLSYLGAVAWGLGIPRVGKPLVVAVGAVTACVLLGDRGPGDSFSVGWGGASRLASAFLMGATLTAMLLGHHYLTAPAMSIEPLKRFVRCMAWGLLARSALAGVGLAVWSVGMAGPAMAVPVSPLFLGVRWGMGLLGPALATYLTWKTVEIRSTQSATGILYIAMTLVLFGELTAMVLSRETGLPF